MISRVFAALRASDLASVMNRPVNDIGVAGLDNVDFKVVAGQPECIIDARLRRYAHACFEEPVGLVEVLRDDIPGRPLCMAVRGWLGLQAQRAIDHDIAGLPAGIEPPETVGDRLKYFMGGLVVLEIDLQGPRPGALAVFVNLVLLRLLGLSPSLGDQIISGSGVQGFIAAGGLRRRF